MLALRLESPVGAIVIEAPSFRLVGSSLRAEPDGGEVAATRPGDGWLCGNVGYSRVGVLSPTLVTFPSGQSRGPYHRLTFLGGSIWDGSALLAVSRPKTGAWRWAGEAAEITDAVITSIV